MAEAVFREQIAQKGWQDQFEIDSAGTSNWHIGKKPHQGTLSKLTEKNIPTEGMFARQVTPQDALTYDYIVAMDETNEQDLQALFSTSSSAQVFKLLDLLEHRADKNVPDPYYTGDFEETYQLVQESVTQLIDKIAREKMMEFEP